MAQPKPKLPPPKGVTDTKPNAGGTQGGNQGGNKKDKKLQKQAGKIVDEWTTFNPGGAPINEEFVVAALEQGLTPKDVRAILRSQALGGPTTGPDFSSPELLDYFTEHPEEIAQLRDAVAATADAPASYAEYLAGGGAPGGYRSQDMLLQEAVLGIGGAREAYLAGTPRARYIAEGNDPNRWYSDRWDFMGREPGSGGGGGTAGPSWMGGFDVLSEDDQMALGGVVGEFMRARQAKLVAQQAYNDPFPLESFEETE